MGSILFVAALTFVAVLPAAAGDDETPRWFGSRFDEMAVLVYGIPDSDYVALAFGCEPGARSVKVDVQDEESEAEEGEPQIVRLAAGGQRVEFSSKGVRNHDSGGIELHGRLPLDGALRHILGSGGQLDIMIGGRTLRYAMAGAAGPAARMLAVCDGRPAGARHP